MSARSNAARAGLCALIQILPKLQSVKFSQNAMRIRFKTGQKPRRRANRTFSPAC
jgi:hypothetical protein